MFENTNTGLAGQLVEIMQEILRQLTEDHNFHWPLTTVAVCSRGNLMAAQYTFPGEAGEIIAQHVVGPGFTKPIHWLVVDCEGKSARVAFETGGVRMTVERDPDPAPGQ